MFLFKYFGRFWSQVEGHPHCWDAHFKASKMYLPVWVCQGSDSFPMGRLLNSRSGRVVRPSVHPPRCPGHLAATAQDAFTTRVPAIRSWRACFFSVKAARM